MGETLRPGGSSLAFSAEIPTPGLCLLGEFFEQPGSRAPSRGAVAATHPRPLPLHVTLTSQSAAASRSAGARGPGRRAGGLGGGPHSGCERLRCRRSFRAQESSRRPSWKLQPPQDRACGEVEKSQRGPGLWSQPYRALRPRPPCPEDCAATAPGVTRRPVPHTRAQALPSVLGRP